MKLKPLGEFLYTSCKDCKFAIYNEATQTGCQADQIERFGEENILEAYDEDKEFYVIKTVCPHMIHKESEATLKDVEKTASLVTFGIALDLCYIKQNAGLIKKTIESICALEYDKTLFKVSVSHKYNISAGEKKTVQNLMGNLNDSDIRTTITLYASAEFAERDRFKSLQYADYVSSIKHGCKLDKKILSQIKHTVNAAVVKPILFSSSKADFVLFRSISSRYYEYGGTYEKTKEGIKTELSGDSLHVKL